MTEKKSTGAHFTPRELAEFVADRILSEFTNLHGDRVTILDPAVGDGELLLAMIGALKSKGVRQIEVTGFDINQSAVSVAADRVRNSHPAVRQRFEKRDFLELVLQKEELLWNHQVERFDIVIANPPYVRTQVLGAKRSSILSKRFGLTGRVDLYYPFLLGISEFLNRDGVCGIIVSNRFMTTKSGESVRSGILQRFSVLQVYDLGDTKLFEAAVLPAVLLLANKDKPRERKETLFTSIYSTTHDGHPTQVKSFREAIEREGVVSFRNNENFLVRRGTLALSKNSSAVWRLANESTDTWLSTVQSNTHTRFGDVGQIKVGVKTTADSIFIRSDWESLADAERPELLVPLTTGAISRRFKPTENHPQTKILYTHTTDAEGKRVPVNLKDYPKSLRYLTSYRTRLDGRKYVREAGRKWFEIWVPHNPLDWEKPKLVFRDIVEHPIAWLDFAGTIVNGDCYWFKLNKGINEDLLWLALAVMNSDFIEDFYDHRFHNKLYAGRRRFMSQYVEEFPLPNPSCGVSQRIITLAKEIYSSIEDTSAAKLETELNSLVEEVFGLVKKV